MEGLRSYVEGGFQKVEGWVLPAAIAALDATNSLCEQHKVEGGACEIGVHHGRFFIALMHCVGSTPKSLALDLFDNQILNIDRSGKGSREKFEENIRAFLPATDNVSIVAGDSISLATPDIVDLSLRFGKFRLFSVDGGHTSVHALNDILIAQDLTANGGIIVIDDFFQPDWPGVTEAVFKYMTFSNAKYYPLCIAGRKLFMTSLSYHSIYLKSLAEKLKAGRSRSIVKPIKICGVDCVSFALHPDDPLIGD